MLHISKIDDDGAELLPDIVDTPLWEYLDPDRGMKAKKTEVQLAYLYKALAARENYYQNNTPTAFGNPQYNYFCGVVDGCLQATFAEESEENGVIVIRSINGAKRVLFSVDKLKKPRSYYESVRENTAALRALGIERFGGVDV